MVEKTLLLIAAIVLSLFSMICFIAWGYIQWQYIRALEARPGHAEILAMLQNVDPEIKSGGKSDDGD